MTNKRLIEITVSALRDDLCGGCEEPYYDGEEFKSCDECRDRAAQQIEEILRGYDSDKNKITEQEVEEEMAYEDAMGYEIQREAEQYNEPYSDFIIGYPW